MKKLTSIFMIVVVGFLFNHVNAIAQNVATPNGILQEQNTMSVLWFQKAGEAKALYYQGYMIGKMRLDEILGKRPKKKVLKPAIVLDIDETILDNSPKYAGSVVSGKAKSWKDWINGNEAKPLPGAIDFLKYADSKGVAIYYITNRNVAEKSATIKNLQHVGAPQADTNHVLLKQPNEKGKEARRQQVAKTHEILLLFGDNLGDFSEFDQLSAAERLEAVDKHKEEFGQKLIVFPNPMYGDWEGALYENNFSKSDKDKAKLRKAQLILSQP
ncbi:MAG TPA: 5'-nucleotidase, lipoprotein e(P4) family [Neobacillus sp.]|jgi:5'-nucleotidase (lipoprotein e(P4) family)